MLRRDVAGAIVGRGDVGASEHDAAGARSLVDDRAYTRIVLDHDAVDQCVDRVGLERGRRELVAVVTQPALNLRHQLRLQRRFPGDDDANVAIGASRGRGEQDERDEECAHINGLG
jgi:hypothetical protein